MYQENTATFTANDINCLFTIAENLNGVLDDINKCNAIADILPEALSGMNDKCLMPSDENTISTIIEIIYDYSYKAKCSLQDAYKKCHNLYSEKRNVNFGGEKCE